MATIISAHQRIRMAFRWWANCGHRLYGFWENTSTIKVGTGMAELQNSVNAGTDSSQ